MAQGGIHLRQDLHLCPPDPAKHSEYRKSEPLRKAHLVMKTLLCASGKRNRENLEEEWSCHKVSDNCKGLSSTYAMVGMHIQEISFRDCEMTAISQS